MEYNRKRLAARIIAVSGGILLFAAVYILFFLGGGKAHYKSLSQNEAIKMMENDNGSLVVDVRTAAEYASGHIPGAICVPLDDIENERLDALPDKNQVLLLYCYSGRRSKEAAEKLAALGYTSAYEFGGILDWKGEVVTD